MLFNAGLQAPVIPFIDVVGNALKAAPEQIAGTAANVGVTFGSTTKVPLTFTTPSQNPPPPALNPPY